MIVRRGKARMHVGPYTWRVIGLFHTVKIDIVVKLKKPDENPSNLVAIHISDVNMPLFGRIYRIFSKCMSFQLSLRQSYLNPSLGYTKSTAVCLHHHRLCKYILVVFLASMLKWRKKWQMYKNEWDYCLLISYLHSVTYTVDDIITNLTNKCFYTTLTVTLTC